jgi:hypothetical protein
MTAFAPGRVMVRRQYQHDLLSRVWAGVVAADDDDGLWMWVGTGSAHRDLGHADGRHLRQIAFTEWRGAPKAYNERAWHGNALMFHPHAGAGDYSVWFYFTDDGGFVRWYVNLEQPVIRWERDGLLGVDTTDFDLDVVVAPDRTWSWKDEEEFTERLAHPDLYWVTDEQAVRDEGLRLIKLADAGDFPFDGTRTAFRPDPAWPVVSAMPPGWDGPRAW